MKDYTTTTLEEYLSLPQNNTNAVLAIPAKALSEIEAAKYSKNRSELVNRTLKKYLINARQAQTNAKIVESLLA
ncbi:MAG: hypothetical protein E7Z93_02235 [Cyanobacteria bacterium SIG32]|nr:hypothetical protein [Cyanobacteria bacterium SIG32]